VLPANASLKDINHFKKELNWGELPPFYHMVANSLAELEGIDQHGFDNALKRIVDKRNWNLDLLGGYQKPSGEIVVERKPRLAIYRLYTVRGYEVHCFPLAKDKEVDQYTKDHPMMEFSLWDPHSMRNLINVAKLKEFVIFASTKGDKADQALVKHAHKVTEGVINTLAQHVEIVKDEGNNIGQFIYQMSIQGNEALQNQLVGELKANPLSQIDINK